MKLKDIIKSFQPNEQVEIDLYFNDSDLETENVSMLEISAIEKLVNSELFFTLYLNNVHHLPTLNTCLKFRNGDFVVFKNGNYMLNTKDDYSYGKVKYLKEIKGIKYFDVKPNQHLADTKFNILTAIFYNKYKTKNDVFILSKMFEEISLIVNKKTSSDYIDFLSSFSEVIITDVDENEIERAIDISTEIVKDAVNNKETANPIIHSYIKKSLVKLKREKCRNCNAYNMYKFSGTLADSSRDRLCSELKVLVDLDSINQEHGFKGKE